MSLRRFATAALIASATFFVTTVGSATIVERLTLEELTAEADAIVHGVVVETGSRWDMERNEPVTVTRVRVYRWLKGGDGATVTIRERGGQVQDRGMWISGTPRYQVNEEIVVFLEAWADRPNAFRTFTMSQGKFQVRHGVGSVPPSVRRNLADVALAHWDTDGQMQLTEGEPEPAMELDTFLAHVAHIVTETSR